MWALISPWGPRPPNFAGEPTNNAGVAVASAWPRIPLSRGARCLRSIVLTLYRRIAWSKLGTVASITDDGLFVELRYLRCDPDNGSWQLSEPTRCDLVSGSEHIPLVHLSWSSTSIPELAIIDAVGRVALLTFSIALNRPYFFRKWDADPVDDLNAIVGCYWLSLTPPGRQYNVLHGPAIKDGSRYRYDSSFVHSFGPFHPNPSKSALVCVTANGQAKLFFSQNNNRVEETSLDIERISSSDDLITHASICSDKSKF